MSYFNPSKAAFLIFSSLLCCAIPRPSQAQNKLPPSSASAQTSPSPANDSAKLETMAGQILLALKKQDGPALAGFVHPTLGLRFTPHTWDNIKENVVLSRAEVAKLYRIQEKKTWGVSDADAPIKMTPAKYMKVYVWNTDYTAVKEKKLESLKTHIEEAHRHLINEAEPIYQTYPDAQVLTYSFPGITGPQGGAMDWSWLTLVFRRLDNNWYLVGLAHNEWAI
jgi:hypothetical protein